MTLSELVCTVLYLHQRLQNPTLLLTFSLP
jgi:hypothetical protein